jgi:hypothetical protein
MHLFVLGDIHKRVAALQVNGRSPFRSASTIFELTDLLIGSPTDAMNVRFITLQELPNSDYVRTGSTSVPLSSILRSVS